MDKITLHRPWYWAHWHNWKYEAWKRVDRACLWFAHRASGRLRMWFVVDATNTARRMYPDPEMPDFAGPDGLTYSHIHDGALREETGGA